MTIKERIRIHAEIEAENKRNILKFLMESLNRAELKEWKEAHEDVQYAQQSAS